MVEVCPHQSIALNNLNKQRFKSKVTGVRNSRQSVKSV